VDSNGITIAHVYASRSIREGVIQPSQQRPPPLCPRCGIDAVIGSKSGYPITIDFFGMMKEHWFQIAQDKPKRPEKPERLEKPERPERPERWDSQDEFIQLSQQRPHMDIQIN